MPKRTFLSQKCQMFMHLGKFFSYLTLVLLNPDILCFANSVDPDQLASEEAN